MDQLSTQHLADALRRLPDAGTGRGTIAAAARRLEDQDRMIEVLKKQLVAALEKARLSGDSAHIHSTAP